MATYTLTDYGSMFAADAYRAIIWEIQTIWPALKVTGHFVGAVFSASNDINYFFSGVFPKQINLAETAPCTQGPEMTTLEI